MNEMMIVWAVVFVLAIFIESETAKLKRKLPHASDWEKIELEERIGGLQFAKACLDEAWDKREV